MTNVSVKRRSRECLRYLWKTGDYVCLLGCKLLNQFYVPSLAFFLLAKVPPSFPRNESSFFLEDGDLGVDGDLGEDGDFWGEDAIWLLKLHHKVKVKCISQVKYALVIIYLS